MNDKSHRKGVKNAKTNRIVSDFSLRPLRLCGELFFSHPDEQPHIRSKWENCIVNVPLPCVADRMEVEYPNILARGTLARMD